MSNQQVKMNINYEQDFYNFLMTTASAYGFKESHKQLWVEYMMDTCRSEVIVNNVFKHFNFHDRASKAVLDVGCGYGSLLILLEQYFDRVCGLDIGEEDVAWSKKRSPDSEVICANATNIPWSNGEFDLVISTDVFEHISYGEQKQAASDIWRTLKPGGHAYIEVPNRFQLLDEHHRVLFATWLPDDVRKKYVNLISGNKRYLQCWERSGRAWKELFEAQGFEVTIKPHYLKGISSLRYLLIPPNRFHLYLTKK
jgi:2-polyprenyl-3-methyl-5-hydroxy-6-metoxy-1,4-benzoquinol methylase